MLNSERHVKTLSTRNRCEIDTTLMPPLHGFGHRYVIFTVVEIVVCQLLQLVKV